jgi:hypothetical protein
VRRAAFRENFVSQLQEDETLDSYLVLSEEATFRLCGIVNRQNMYVWGNENPHASVEFMHNSPNMNVFCALFKDKVYGSCTVADLTYQMCDVL